MKTCCVRDVMSTPVYALGPDTSVVTAARLFATRHITGAPVIDRRGHAIGVITQSDLVDPDRPRTAQPGRSAYYCVEEGIAREISFEVGEEADGADGVVGDLMSPYVLTIPADAALLDAIRLLAVEEVHRLVVTWDHRLAGIITSMDVLKAIAARAGTVVASSPTSMR